MGERLFSKVEMFNRKAIEALWLGTLLAGSPCRGSEPLSAVEQPEVSALAQEVSRKGWIIYASRSQAGDWDLFTCRPDASAVRNVSNTPEYNEAAPQFSRDGRKVLYRRLPRQEKIDGNRYGEQGQLVVAVSDGTHVEVIGQSGEYPWASWSPDGKQIACLSIQGISIIDLESRRVVRTFPRKGFFQQLTWSPDGKWLSGVANSYGTGWSIARIEIATGAANAVNRVDCCTPDWFPDSANLIFSWRRPGAKTNRGYGWTQLWRAQAEGKSPQLVYAEDGRHVYGGHVSPDGRYVLFTGNMEEDGDPGKAGSPMGLMRLADAPIIGGSSEEVRKNHPEAKEGPVLTLPVGWEPSWTFAELGSSASTAAVISEPGKPTEQLANPNSQSKLSSELHEKGWLAFSAPTEHGDWDLFLMRPDGSDRRKLTDTREFNEAGVRFSPNGQRLLYYRLPKSEPVDNNNYGTFELVLADADGRNPVSYGNEFHWASWSPDGSQLACLSAKGIEIVDIATRKVVRQLGRKGIVQQLIWSPDGQKFVGTANGLGPYWNIGCLNVESDQIKVISETERYNCTPDWCSDSKRVVYARGIVPNSPGRAELWVAGADGSNRQLLYAEAGRHIYGACPSPDGRYLLFTRSVEDLGRVDHTGTTMAVIRWSGTPMLGDGDQELQKHVPNASSGPRLDLGVGWEPHWTYRDVGGAATQATK